MRNKAELQSKFKNYMSKPMSKAELQSKLRHYVSKPKRALHKARDFYVKSMEECAGKVGYGGVIGCPAAPQVSRLPGSFSVNNEEIFMNFLEAMSKTRSMESNLQEEEIRNAMKDEYGGLKEVTVVSLAWRELMRRSPAISKKMCCMLEAEVMLTRDTIIIEDLKDNWNLVFNRLKPSV